MIKNRTMPPDNLEALEVTLMQLPHQDRVLLTERLLASLDEEDEILAEWVAEAELRLDAQDHGEVEAIRLENTMAQLRTGLPGNAAA